MILSPLQQASAIGENLQTMAGELRSVALRALRRMYRPEESLFAFTLRRHGSEVRLEGVSRRYTAIVLIGLAGEEEEASSSVLHGQRTVDVCGRLLASIDRADDIGEVALALWAGRVHRHPHASKALARLRLMQPNTGAYPTVELAWSLTALSIADVERPERELAGSIARRLLGSFSSASGLFPHCPFGVRSSWWRGHVTCFADLVYPIQALAYYYRLTGDNEALKAARRCAERICALQGPAGQWWWHYDYRTGRVLEGYPVYAIHQDAMAPMALFALENASGVSYRPAIEKGLDWLIDPPETGKSLWDRPADLIWRKVARHEPGKLVRALQASASRLHPRLRVPVDRLFPPGFVDYESRPYHMGWILHAWPGPDHSPRRTENTEV